MIWFMAIISVNMSSDKSDTTINLHKLFRTLTLTLLGDYDNTCTNQIKMKIPLTFL